MILPQHQSFPNDWNNLIKVKIIDNTGVLKSLNTSYDDGGLIRLGSRLKNSLLPYNEEHPIELPKNPHVSYLIIQENLIQNIQGGRCKKEGISEQ